MSLTEAKFALASGLCLIGLAGGAIALVIGQWPRTRTWMSILNAGAGGVFLGAALLTMLPHAAHAWSTGGRSSPGAYLLALVGIVAMLLVDRVLLPFGPTGQSPAADGTDADTSARLSAFTVGTAMCTHTMLAGMAMGVQPTVAAALVIFTAVGSHKGSAAFSLMVMMQRAGIRRAATLVMLLLFSLSAAAGTVLAMWLTRDTSAQRYMLQAIFSALTAGIFMYVATVHVISKEFATREHRTAKFVALVAGAALMAILAHLF